MYSMWWYAWFGVWILVGNPFVRDLKTKRVVFWSGVTSLTVHNIVQEALKQTGATTFYLSVAVGRRPQSVSLLSLNLASDWLMRDTEYECDKHRVSTEKIYDTTHQKPTHTYSYRKATCSPSCVHLHTSLFLLSLYLFTSLALFVIMTYTVLDKTVLRFG